MATYREITVTSAWFGWWGIQSLIYNLGGFVVNAMTRRRLAALPTPETYWGHTPMDPGKPLFRRLGALGFGLPFAVVFGVVSLFYLADQIAIDESMQRVTSGQCVGRVEVGWFGNEVRLQKVACADPAAMGRVLLKVVGSPDRPSGVQDCAGIPSTQFTHSERGFILCVGPQN
ncbi:hypothetical protein [Nocardia sp. NPDC058666]|uniref:hypothetical protein n=1 Tax=Nocardia sp. NPDC058666 TaxID=3346587 RepID=UPI003666E6E5